MPLAWQALGHLVEHVGGLVDPTALFPGLSVNLAKRLPEAHGAVADSQFGAGFQAPALEVEQQFLPALRALAIAVHHTNDVLVAQGIGGDDHQHALLVMVQAGREIDPVGPEIDIALGRQIALLPGFVFIPPDCLQPTNGAGRQARSVRTQQRHEGLGEIAAGYPLQVKPGQQRLHRLAAPQIGRQD